MTKKKVFIMSLALILILGAMPAVAFGASQTVNVSYKSDTSVKAWGPVTTEPSGISDSSWGTQKSAVAAWKHPSWPLITGSTAAWISTSYYTETPVGSNSWRKFEVPIEIPSNATHISGSVKVTSDNAEAVYLNGVHVATDGEVFGAFVDNSEWSTVLTRTLSLTTGTNTLTFITRNYAGNSDPTQNPTGLTFLASVQYTLPNVVPVVNAGANATITEGTTFTRTGSFSDSDTDSWTATVNYGSGSQPLALGSDKSFTLSHTYPDNGAYSIVVNVNDGEATGTATVEVTVTNVAPTLGSIGLPAAPVAVGSPVNASVSFTDPGVLDTHTATWQWGDGNTTPGTVDENNGSGSVTGSHTYSVPGVYSVIAAVTDKDGGTGSATATQYVVVYDPSGGFVTGGGWIMSPAGAYAAEPTLTGKATFGFVAKYKPGATVPTGNTEFQFHAGNLKFKSTDYDWLVVAGSKAQFKGIGTINGAGTYKFMVSAVDNGNTGDTFRIKIVDTSGNMVYDNMLGNDEGADPTTTLGGGNIVVHR